MRDEAFYAEKETTRRRPTACGVGPQGTPVEWFEEETYFFRLSAYQDKLLAHYEKNPDFILPPRAAQRGRELRQGRAGGPVHLAHHARLGHPGAGRAGHVMYVWVDALTNYITGVGFPDENDARWRYWPADVHVIGKDILRFHAVYWPAFLMSAGIELPKRVFGHGFVLNRGEKMSKSVGNVVDPFDLVEAYGVDQVRYFFLREVVFGQDGSYSHEAIVNRINADLANDLGNLAQRSLSMIAKNCDGKIPRARRLHGGGQGDPGGGRRDVRQGARGHGPAGHQAVPGRRVGRGGRRQPLLRGRGAVGQGQDRPQAHGHDPLRDGGGGAAGRDPGAAGDAGVAGKLLDGLGQGAEARSFAALGEAGRLRPARPSRRRPACSRAMSSRRRGARREPKPKPKKKGKPKQQKR